MLTRSEGSVLAREPGLRFWLRYAEREGALYEDLGEQALVVLPHPLREAFDLPEDVAVTADPDVSREDGALLLIPGHPVLDEAATRVLDRGDAGRAFLPWPASALPRRLELVERARRRFAVEHGRVDPAGEPARGYLPVLRVGALVTYTCSLDERFQEREEIWVDGRTGLEADELRGLAEGRPWLDERDSSASVLPADLRRAAREADAALRRRAGARLEQLAAGSRGALRDERARAEAYYEDALRSIARRREGAPAERQAILDAQAEVTRAERARRVAEIDEQFRGRFDIRPFRAHLVAVPSLSVPVVIRRGERVYPLTLVWVLHSGTFTDVRCPHCAATSPLVASRERLGCAACLPARSEALAPVAAGRVIAPPLDAPQPADTRPQQAPNGGRARPAAKTARPAPLPARDRPARRDRIIKEGDKLAVRFWRAVGEERRWPNKAIVRHSPMKVLTKLYGVWGPAFAIGVPPEQEIVGIRAATAPLGPELPEITTGHVESVGRDYAFAGEYPFTLRWRLEAGVPVVEEVLPLYGVLDHKLGARSKLARRLATRLYDAVPDPRVELDPVAAELWGRVADLGLPLVVRCIATWWRVRAGLGVEDAAPVATATALAGLVGRRAGVRQATGAAGTPGSDPLEVAEVLVRLAEHVRGRREPW